LDQIGIRNSLQFFPHVLTREKRNTFAKQVGIEEQDILEMTKLTDVARLKYVGPRFARLLVQTQFDTVEKIANSNFGELHRALVRANEESGIHRGKLGIDDMKSWINMVVQDVPQVIEY
jgi:hypothetical protein